MRCAAGNCCSAPFQLAVAPERRRRGRGRDESGEGGRPMGAVAVPGAGRGVRGAQVSAAWSGRGAGQRPPP